MVIMPLSHVIHVYTRLLFWWMQSFDLEEARASAPAGGIVVSDDEEEEEPVHP